MPLQIKSNPYISNCDSSAFSVLFNDSDPNHKIKFIHGMLKYTEFRKDTDIFQYIYNLQDLQQNNTYFVFDASTEGFSPFVYPFFDVLYFNCQKYDIDPSKIIYVSSNMYDKENIVKYNALHAIKKSINVFSFLSFKKTVRDLLENRKENILDPIRYYKKWREQNTQLFNNKIFLSLSRVNRLYRTYGLYQLYNSDIATQGLLSHNSMSKNEILDFCKEFGISKQDGNFWKNSLPLVADTADFATNHALSLSSHLHNQTLFQIVNETEIFDYNKTALFYSEKTFKPIAHMQPFLIWGQPGCNTKLQDFGFELYDELFDYSFDFIEDPLKRYRTLQNNVTNAVLELKKKTKKRQLEWRWKCKEKLLHNFEIFANSKKDLIEFKKLHKRLNS